MKFTDAAVMLLCGLSIVVSTANAEHTYEFGACEQQLMWRDGGRLSHQMEHLEAMKKAGVAWVRLSLIYQTNLDKNLFAILRRCDELDIKVLMVIENRPQLYPAGTKRRPGSEPAGKPAWPCYRLSELDLDRAEAYLHKFFTELKSKKCTIDAFELFNEINWFAFNGDLPVIRDGLWIDENTDWENPVFVQYRKGLDKVGQLTRILYDLNRQFFKGKPEIITAGLVAYDTMNTKWLAKVNGCVVDQQLTLQLLHGSDPRQNGATNWLLYVDGIGMHIYPATADLSPKTALAEIAADLDPCRSVPGIGSTKPLWITECGYSIKKFDNDETRRYEQHTVFYNALDTYDRKDNAIQAVMHFCWSKEASAEKAVWDHGKFYKTSDIFKVRSAQRQLKPLERIGIRASQDGAKFVGTESGKPFFVKGFNYIRLRGDHSTFDADTENTKAAYDSDRAEAMFSALSKAGYNTVRVFIIGRSKVNPGIAGNYDTTKAIYEPYMDNVLDFLRRATRHGIYVFPTFGDGGVPLNAYYRERVRGKGHNKNVFVLTREGIAARRKHITSFLSYIKDKEPALLPTLLGLQCQNEAYLRGDQWPFTQKEGKFAAANGKAYDLSSTEQRQALMDEGYRFYHKRVVEAVKAIDPDMLVSEGVFVPRAVGKDPSKHAGVWPGKTRDERYPPTLTTIGTGSLDFLDVHFYHVTPNPKDVAKQFRRNLGSTNFFTPEMTEIRKKTPVIMGEFGAFDDHEKTFAAAVDNLVQVRDLANKENVNGMLFWTYDCQEQARLYHATDDWELFYRKMDTFEKDTE